jgi:hypothetical protein
MLIALSISIICTAAIIFFSRRLFRYLCHFQEVKYSRAQFSNWLVTNGIYDKKGSAISTIAALAIELTKEKILISLAVSMLGAIAMIWLGYWEADPRKPGFLQLEATAQAIALYNLSLSLYSICLIVVMVATYALGAGDDIACYWLVVIFAIQSSPTWLFIASNLLKKSK